MDSEKEEGQKPGDKIKTSAKSLRTYQGDVEEAISKNHYSTTTVFVAEQKKRTESAPTLLEIQKDYSGRNKLFVIIGLTLFVLGIITIVLVLYIKSQNEVVAQRETSALIGYSEEKKISIASSSKEKLIADIAVERQSLSLPINSVLYVNIVNASSTPEDVKDVLTLVTPQMPSTLIRSFDGEYMFGIYSFGINKPFIILKTTDFASSFSGMLKWEKYMDSDLGDLFSLPKNTGTTTIEFKDEAFYNKDLRVLQDEAGKTMLLYSFIDKGTLVITSNENILTAIIGKYNVSKQIK